MKKGRLQEIVAELQGASKMHLKQSKEIEKHIKEMKSPAEMRKTTKGKGRTFRTEEEGAGMTSKKKELVIIKKKTQEANCKQL